MTWEQLFLLIGAVGGGAILPKTFEAIKAALTGRARAERDAVEEERKRADAAWVHADRMTAAAEASRTTAAAEIETVRRAAEHDNTVRRRVQEWASTLVRMLREAPCVDPRTIPPYPVTDEYRPVGPEEDTVQMSGPRG